MTNTLNILRQSIDNFDTALMLLLAERSKLIVKIGVIKKEQNLSLQYSPERKQNLEKTQKIAIERNLDPKLIEQLLHIIYLHAVEMMKEIQIRDQDQDQDHGSSAEEMPSLRESIYNLDIAICHILAERFRIVKLVGQYKKQRNMAPLVQDRWQQLLQHKIEAAQKLGIDVSFVKSIFTLIHEYSLKAQNSI